MNPRKMMLTALAKVAHPSIAFDEEAKRAVIVKVVQDLHGITMPGKDVRMAYTHLRHSLIGTSPVRHDQLALCHAILAGDK